MPIQDQKVRDHARKQGLRNHSNFSAIAELVDNAEDAQARRIRVDLLKPGANGKGKDYCLKERVLMIVDSGKGLDSMDDLFHMASNKQRKSNGSTRGTHGMGAKNAIDRLGRHALVFSKRALCNAKEEFQHAKDNNFYCKLGIFPFHKGPKNRAMTARQRKASQSEDTKHQVRKTAELNMLMKQDDTEKTVERLAWHIPPKRENSALASDERDIVDFLIDQGPFAISPADSAKADESDCSDDASEPRENMAEKQLTDAICNIVADLSKIENTGMQRTQGTIFLIWGIHSSTGGSERLPEYLLGEQREITTNPQRLNLREYFTFYRGVYDQLHDSRVRQLNRNPLLTIQGRAVHPLPFRVLCCQESIVYGEYRPLHATARITFEIAEVLPYYQEQFNGINYYWQNRQISRVSFASSMPASKRYALFIDMSRVAVANQYKSKFDTDLDVDHLYGSKKSVDRFITFEKLSEKLRDKFKDYVNQMNEFRKHKIMWYDDYPENTGLADDVILQCSACAKLRMTPKDRLAQKTQKKLELTYENGMWCPQSNTFGFDCNHLSDPDKIIENPCLRMVDEILCFTIGYGTICDDESCVKCKVERKMKKDKIRPEYFLNRNKKSFEKACVKATGLRKQAHESEEVRIRREHDERIREEQSEIEKLKSRPTMREGFRKVIKQKQTKRIQKGSAVDGSQRSKKQQPAAKPVDLTLDSDSDFDEKWEAKKQAAQAAALKIKQEAAEEVDLTDASEQIQSKQPSKSTKASKPIECKNVEAVDNISLSDGSDSSESDSGRSKKKRATRSQKKKPSKNESEVENKETVHEQSTVVADSENEASPRKTPSKTVDLPRKMIATKSARRITAPAGHGAMHGRKRKTSQEVETLSNGEDTAVVENSTDETKGVDKSAGEKLDISAQPISPVESLTSEPRPIKRRKTDEEDTQEEDLDLMVKRKVEQGIRQHASNLAKTLHVKKFHTFLADVEFNKLPRSHQTRFKLLLCETLFQYDS